MRQLLDRYFELRARDDEEGDDVHEYLMNSAFRLHDLTGWNPNATDFRLFLHDPK